MKRKRIKKYSEYINIDTVEFTKRHVLNPTISEDVPLFVDPRLLKNSRYEIFRNSSATFDSFYSKLATQIRSYIKIPDSSIKQKVQNNIIRILSAPETVGLCLGYSKNNTNGQGVGRECAKKLFMNAVEIYSLLPNIGDTVFSLLGLLTEGIGADYIGDITSRIILKEIYQFTEMISREIGITTFKYILNDKEYYLPRHPNATAKRNFPILFVPMDILTDLPKDADIEDVFNGYITDNDVIRNSVNDKIANILESDYKKAQKQTEIYDLLKENKHEIEQVVEYLKTVEGKNYNFDADPKNIMFRDRLSCYLRKCNFVISEEENLKIIDYIVQRFEKFIRHNNILKRELLWDGDKYKCESAWQQVFHAFVSEFLYSNDIDFIPERETQSGPVDFCFSKGSRLRVLVELKLSVNAPQKGLERQLERYKECIDNVKAAYFICFNVHKDKSSQKILAELTDKKRELNLDTKIIVIDGHIEPSASNL